MNEDTSNIMIRREGETLEQYFQRIGPTVGYHLNLIEKADKEYFAARAKKSAKQNLEDDRRAREK